MGLFWLGSTDFETGDAHARVLLRVLSTGGHECGRGKEQAIASADAARTSHRRYMHYFSRYSAHMESLKLERQMRRRVERKILELECSADSAHADRAAVCNISTGSFDVTASCAENYEGTATVAACTTAGPYTLSGCEPIVCVSPANTAGYETPTETELSTAAGFDVTTTCAAH